MEFTDFKKQRLNIDYAGSYVEKETQKPALILRLYIDVDHKDIKRGVNISTEPVGSLENAVNDLSWRVDKWIKDKYDKESNTKSVLESSTELKRKFNNWLNIKPHVLQSAKTLEVDL